jgi:hypothetical protein
MKFILAAAFISFASLASANELVSLVDAANDDFGAGDLVYPERQDYSKGDLDLRALRISSDAKGYWFEATFANPIRDPAQARSGIGPEPMPVSARRGFYTFNLDIYVDTDRVPGSGNTFTLPGRKARIDSAYAWERVVVLTPKPEVARGELFDVLARQFPERSRFEAEASIDQAVFFPTEVRVRGKSVEFFVPASFFGASDGSDWAVTALVTGAKPYSTMSLSFLPTGKTPLEQLDMGAMQPAPGRPQDTFGYEAAQGASPIVDVLMPTVAQQVALIGNDEPLLGMSWGPHAVNELAQAGRYEQGAQAFKARRKVPARAEESIISTTMGSLRNWFGGDSKRSEVGATRPSKPASVQSFLDPGAKTGAGGHQATPAQAPVPDRLRTLQQLYDDKLIDEAEYKKHKQRILGDL